jgi:hypothetical protein
VKRGKSGVFFGEGFLFGDAKVEAVHENRLIKGEGK